MFLLDLKLLLIKCPPPFLTLPRTLTLPIFGLFMFDSLIGGLSIYSCFDHLDICSSVSIKLKIKVLVFDLLFFASFSAFFIL